MARKKQSRGNCTFCGKEMTKGGLTRHLKTCSAREEANQKANGRVTALYHLQIWDKYDPDYWLQLEVRGDAKLADLDRYLRAIWLECCGHLSMFSAGGWGEELAMRAKIGVIFPQLAQLTYIYDFGTSSELAVKMVGVREGKPLSARPIHLLARNQLP
ncbi:MAG TPA: hypothetical protein ENJ56_05225, partial [Anaerolineae bacterium]|nr:hypothetical protein [Anaerolineae bacterium]